MDEQPSSSNFQPQPHHSQQDQIDYIQQLQNNYVYDDYSSDNNYDSHIFPKKSSSKNQPSSKSSHHQHPINYLIDTIYKQCAKIDELTHLGIDGSFVLYWKAGWKMGVCEEYMARGGDDMREMVGWKHMEMEEGMGKKGDIGEQGLKCTVCYQTGCTKVRNICGHFFCKKCWTNYLSTSLDSNPNIPFPPCMKQDCPIAMSITLCRLLCQSLSSSSSIKSNRALLRLNSKFTEVLCRSYAAESTSVKMCKGRHGTCTQCFQIQPSNMLGVIVCQSCDNYVCPRCEQRYHGASNCKLIQKWHEILLTTMDLQQFSQFSYQCCPNCKNGVQRIPGTHEIVCRCDTRFCYYCGEIWDQFHMDNSIWLDFCPNYYKVKEIYRERQARRKGKVNQLCIKIETVKEATDSIESMILKIKKFKQKLPVIIKKFLQCFKFHENQLKILQYYCNFMKKTLCILSGETISAYFIENSRSDFFTQRLHYELSKIYTFTFDFVEEMYKFLLDLEEMAREDNENKDREIQGKDNQDKDKDKDKDKNEQKNKVVNKTKIYRTQEQHMYLLRSKENFQELFFEKIKELEGNQKSIIEIARKEFQSDVF